MGLKKRIRGTLPLLLAVAISGCKTEISTRTQAETGFVVGHAYRLVHDTRAEAETGPFGGKVVALWLRYDPAYAVVVLHDGKRTWNRPDPEGLTARSKFVVIPDGTLLRVSAIRLLGGESDTDVMIFAQVENGPFKGTYIDVRDVCDGFARQVDDYSGVFWLNVRNPAYLIEDTGSQGP